jgi:hypothetical protein
LTFDLLDISNRALILGFWPSLVESDPLASAFSGHGENHMRISCQVTTLAHSWSTKLNAKANLPDIIVATNHQRGGLYGSFLYSSVQNNLNK